MGDQRARRGWGPGVPGRWDRRPGIGDDLESAVGTLVEQTTRYVLLLHLPGGRDAHLVGQAMRRGDHRACPPARPHRRLGPGMR